jgi:hypothetical protein
MSGGTVLVVVSIVHQTACLLKARIVEPEKKTLISNGCVTRNNRVAVFSVRSVPRLRIEDKLPLRDSLETAVRKVEVWFEMVPSLRGCEPGNRGTSSFG